VRCEDDITYSMHADISQACRLEFPQPGSYAEQLSPPRFQHPQNSHLHLSLPRCLLHAPYSQLHSHSGGSCYYGTITETAAVIKSFTPPSLHIHATLWRFICSPVYDASKPAGISDACYESNVPSFPVDLHAICPSYELRYIANPDTTAHER
jgi:hypothetical protein